MSKSLQEIRDALDEVDQRIVDALAARHELIALSEVPGSTVFLERWTTTTPTRRGARSTSRRSPEPRSVWRRVARCSR